MGLTLAPLPPPTGLELPMEDLKSLGLRLAEYPPSSPKSGLELLMVDLESLCVCVSGY